MNWLKGGLVVLCLTLAIGCNDSPPPRNDAPQPYIPQPDATWADQTDPQHELQIITIMRSADSTLGLLRGEERYSLGGISPYVGMFSERGVIIKVDSAGLHRFYQGKFAEDTAGKTVLKLMNSNGDTVVFAR